MVSDRSLKICQIGELSLLKRLQAFCPADLIGDDGAILSPQPGYDLVVTTDMLVDRVHFSDQTTAPEDVGWRGAAANLSDLAAMGATPLGLTVALGLPGDLAVGWLERLYQGLTACLHQFNTVLVGGDVCRSPVITLGITAIGQVRPEQAIRRSTAQPGDAIVVTGVHGASRAGLELLQQPIWGKALSVGDRKALIKAHQRPSPRLDVIQTLRQQSPDLRVSGMDSSDGLADAVLQICRASQVGARLDWATIPLPEGFQNSAVLSPQQALDWSLYGGEDFELVLCLNPDAAKQLVPDLGSKAAIVGEIVAGSEVTLKVDHQVICLNSDQTFQHF
ncbi:MAG: thiamine-phosphate kinase [Aphanocapsa sp. GSE-SYN-MK-11-07L]|jgi:thiamine-monophosphate kinase|nr:thiamine-phosphate kinase [Aphanocapsa sp. GSE-SYN-MK-11-07L]